MHQKWKAGSGSICIKVKSWIRIRIRIKVKSRIRIRIRIEVKSTIRSRNTAGSSEWLLFSVYITPIPLLLLVSSFRPLSRLRSVIHLPMSEVGATESLGFFIGMKFWLFSIQLQFSSFLFLLSSVTPNWAYRKRDIWKKLNEKNNLPIKTFVSQYGAQKLVFQIRIRIFFGCRCGSNYNETNAPYKNRYVLKHAIQNSK